MFDSSAFYKYQIILKIRIVDKFIRLNRIYPVQTLEALSTLDWAGSVTADVVTGRFVTGHVGQADDSHQKQELFHLATCIIRNLAPYSHWCSQCLGKTLMNNIQYTALTVFYTTLFFLSRLCCVSTMSRFVKDSSINSIFVKFQ